MAARALRVGGVFAIVALQAASAAATDTITLANGRVIEADRAWFEGSQLLYEKAGGVFGLPRRLVASVTTNRSNEASLEDPDVARAISLAKGGHERDAAELLRAALAREPRNLEALKALAATSLRSGDPKAAAEAALRAIHLDERDPRSHALLGDAQSGLGNWKAAASAYRASLRIAADDAVQKKLDAVQPRATPRTAGAQFRLRYEGGVNEPLGLAVLAALSDAFSDHSRRLRYTPPEPVTVLLQTETEFQGGGAPIWAESVYDGTVRIPVKGVEPQGPRLRGLLRHELAHSFVTSRTGGNCPTWIQEGVAQWLEGGDPSRADASLGQRARSGTLFPLLTLEAPFQNLAEPDVPVAYAESLSGIAHLLRARGDEGLERLLAALGDGLPSEEALPVAVGMSYGEFQRDWEQHLRTADRK